MSFKSLKIWMLAISSLLSVQTFSQDLIARQAPIDRKLKSVDSLALQKQIQAERSEFPALSLYHTWDNRYVHSYGKAVVVPDSFKFDLRNFSMPTTNTRITDVFGYRPRRRRMHKGLDIKVYIGDTIRAAFSGKVRIVRYERRGYGRYVVIRHDNGLETVYGHMSKQLVKQNMFVKAGDPIGLGGNTGRSTGSHLHFETRFLGIAINPSLIFDFKKQDIKSDYYTFHKAKRRARRSYASGKGYYKVRKGDTLSRIASRRGISVRQLCRLNGIKKTTILRIGMVLRC